AGGGRGWVAARRGPPSRFGAPEQSRCAFGHQFIALRIVTPCLVGGDVSLRAAYRMRVRRARRERSNGFAMPTRRTTSASEDYGLPFTMALQRISLEEQS